MKGAVKATIPMYPSTPTRATWYPRMLIEEIDTTQANTENAAWRTSIYLLFNITSPEFRARALSDPLM